MNQPLRLYATVSVQVSPSATLPCGCQAGLSFSLGWVGKPCNLHDLDQAAQLVREALQDVALAQRKARE